MATKVMKFKEYSLDNLFIGSNMNNEEYGYGDDPFQGIYDINERLSISIARHEYTYGNEYNQFEACIMLDGKPAYDKELWFDVRGYLSNDDVADIITESKELNHADFSHGMIFEDGYEEDDNQWIDAGMRLLWVISVLVMIGLILMLW